LDDADDVAAGVLDDADDVVGGVLDDADDVVGGVLDDADDVGGGVLDDAVDFTTDEGVSSAAVDEKVDGEDLFPTKEVDGLAFEEEEYLEGDPMPKPGGVGQPTEDPGCESGDGAETSWTSSSLLRT
jgi:hypothetical protein